METALSMTGSTIHGPESVSGISRKSYLLLTIAVGVLLELTSTYYNTNFDELSSDTKAWFSVTFLICACLAISLVVKRIQNIGFSGWWAVFGLVPIANIVVGVACLACPTGYAQTRKMDTVGKITASACFLFFLL